MFSRIGFGMIALMGLVFAGCDKGAAPTAEGPKSLLTGKDWSGKVHTVTPGLEMGNGQAPITDWFQLSPACAHDDTWRFESDGTYAVDAGKSRCEFQDATGPVERGRWTLDAEGKTLTLRGEYAMEPQAWALKDLDGKSFQASFAYPITLNGKAQTETVTFEAK
jgi:hypothetical protein